MPAEAFGPFRWDVFTLWHREPADAQDTFEQRVVLQRPDGKMAVQALSQFTMSKSTHRIVVHNSLFPIGLEGEYSLRLWLRNHSQDAAWPAEPHAQYPLHVKHAPRAVVTE